MSEQMYEEITFVTPENVRTGHGRKGFGVINGYDSNHDEVVIFPGQINDYNINCKHAKPETIPLSLFVSDESGCHGVYICLECVLEAYDQLVKDGKIKPLDKINSIKEI